MLLASGIKLELIALNLATPIEAESAMILPLKYKFNHGLELVPKSYVLVPPLIKGIIEPLTITCPVLLLILVIETPSKADTDKVPIVAVPLTYKSLHPNEPVAPKS